MGAAAWISDLPGYKQVIDARGATDIPMPVRGILRFVPGTTIVDNPFKKSTDIGVGLGLGSGPSPGTGDVVGPASATDNALALFSTTSGKLLKNSLVTADVSGNVATPGTVNGLHIGYSEVTANLTANTEDLAIAGLSEADVVALTSTGAFDLGGLVGAPTWKRRKKLIVNRGSNTISLKNQSGGSSALNRFLVATGAAHSLAANAFVEVYQDTTTGRLRITPPGTGGGGTQTLASVLGFGNNAGGANVIGVGVFASQGELDVQQGGNSILSTASGSTLLRAVSSGFTFRKASNDLVYLNETVARNELFFSALRATAFLSAAAPASGDAVHVSIQAGVFGGTGDKAGGRVKIQGTPHLGAGAVGGVDINQTSGAPLATMNDAAATFAVPLASGVLTVSGLATTGSFHSLSTGEFDNTIMVRVSGSGVPVASFAGLRLPANTTHVAARNFANSADIGIIHTDAANVLYFGDNSNGFTMVEAGSQVRIRILGIPKLSITATNVINELANYTFASGLTSPEYGQLSHGSGAGGAVLFSGQHAFGSGNNDGGWATVVGGKPNGTGLKGGFRLSLRNASNVAENLFGGYSLGSGHDILMIGANHTAPTTGTFPTPGNGVVAHKAIDKTTVGTPPAGWVYWGFDTTTKQLFSKNDAGTVHDYT